MLEAGNEGVARNFHICGRKVFRMEIAGIFLARKNWGGVTVRQGRC